MDLSNQPVRSYSKEMQTKKVRQKKTARQRGDIPEKARKEAAERAQGRCEWCGWVNGSIDPEGVRMGLQAAHLIRRRNIEDETTGKDIAYLCGPSVNSKTCHNILDYTKEGAKRGREYRKKLYGG